MYKKISILLNIEDDPKTFKEAMPSHYKNLKYYQWLLATANKQSLIRIFNHKKKYQKKISIANSISNGRLFISDGKSITKMFKLFLFLNFFSNRLYN